MIEIIILEDGKYKFEKHEDGSLICKRYGENWREFIGDNAVHALFDYAFKLTIKENN
jgi:hypothetical protein